MTVSNELDELNITFRPYFLAKKGTSSLNSKIKSKIDTIGTRFYQFWNEIIPRSCK